MAHSRSSSYPYKTQNTMNDTFFFFNDTATTEIYTLSLHDALPILIAVRHRNAMPNLEWIELAARLGSAVLAGAILGVNRDLHRQPAGLRTHALVCLGSAVGGVVVGSVAGAGADAVARVIHGGVHG